MADKKLQYTIELIDNLTKDFKRVFDKVEADINNLQKNIGTTKFKLLDEQQINRELGFFKRKYNEIKKEISKPLTIEDAIHQVTKIGIPGITIKKAINQASTIQYGMANIKKVLPRASINEINSIKQEVDDMVRNIPKAKEDIIAAYQVAAQSLPMSEVKEYLTNVEQMSVAFDMNPQEVSRSMMFIKKNLELGGGAMKEFGDQVAYMHHHFGNAMVPDIIQATSKMSGLGKMVGLTKEQMLGLSVLSLESGVDVSRTSNAVQRGMISRLGSLSGTKKGISGLKALGIDPQEFDKVFKKDKFGAFIQLLEKVDKMSRSGIDVTKPLQNLIGLHYYDVVAQLASKVDILKASYDDLSKTTKWAGEASEGYAKILDTQHSKEIMLIESYKNLKEQLGTHLLPAVSDITDGFKTFNYGLADVIKHVPNATKLIVGLTTAVIALRAAKLALQAASWIGLLPGGKYAAAIAAVAATAIGGEYFWNKRKEGERRENKPEMTLLPEVKRELEQKAFASLGILNLQNISIPKDKLSGTISSGNYANTQGQMSAAFSSFPQIQMPNFSDNMKQQRGGIDVHVYDHKTEVKVRDGGNYDMSVKEQGGKNWQDLMGLNYGY